MIVDEAVRGHVPPAWFWALPGIDRIRAFEQSQLPSPPMKCLGIDIRAGIHTGECELQGRSLTGMAVHVAARIQRLAGPGDILVSGTVKDIGMPGEWRLFSLAD